MLCINNPAAACMLPRCNALSSLCCSWSRPCRCCVADPTPFEISREVALQGRTLRPCWPIGTPVSFKHVYALPGARLDKPEQRAQARAGGWRGVAASWRIGPGRCSQI